jgi:hypothetical protein
MRDKMEFTEFVNFKTISFQFKAFIAEFVLAVIEESCIDPMVEGLKDQRPIVVKRKFPVELSKNGPLRALSK